MKILLILSLILILSACNFSSDKYLAILDPLFVPKDLTEQDLLRVGFEKTEYPPLTTTYTKRIGTSELSYDFSNGNPINKIYAIPSNDLNSFLRKYDAQIVDSIAEESKIKLMIRSEIIEANRVQTPDGEKLQIVTDLFHQPIH